MVQPAIAVFLLVLIDIVSFLFVSLSGFQSSKKTMKHVPYLDHTESSFSSQVIAKFSHFQQKHTLTYPLKGSPNVKLSPPKKNLPPSN